jgi:ABC-type multidrug transport system fused ATPase/permease subunit
MKIPWPSIAGWIHAVVLGALPWCAWWEPRWAPAMVAALIVARVVFRGAPAADPWPEAATVAVAAVFLLVAGGWQVAAGWLALALVVCASARWLPSDGGARPDGADLLAVVGWAAAIAAQPTLVTIERGGWLGPAVLLIAARGLGSGFRVVSRSGADPLGPPTREVRGTLSLRGVVASSTGLPATVPINLDLRAGESLAVLCDDPVAAQALADTIVGRTRPHSGEISIDGSPPGRYEVLIAMIAPGEPFAVGSLDHNLGALRDEPPDRTTVGAARDACGLAEVIDRLDGRPLGRDGSPLETYHRLLVLAARVLVSHYRLVVVVDPEPWVDARRGDQWRAALVRASVGRTAIWITADPELADRADHVHELVDGSLRAR